MIFDEIKCGFNSCNIPNDRDFFKRNLPEHDAFISGIPFKLLTLCHHFKNKKFEYFSGS